MIKAYGYPKDKKLCRTMGGIWSKKESCWLFADYLENEVRTKLGFKENDIVITYSKYTCPPILDFKHKTIPYGHQITAFHDSMQYDGFALFSETGTGKTKVAIDNISCRLNSKQIKKCLIICPKSAMQVWANEIKKHSDMEYLVIYNHNNSLRKGLFDSFITSFPIPIGIMNYAGLTLLEDLLKHHINEKTMLIFDESTWIKNARAMRTKIAMKIAKNAGYRMVISGTPITNNIIDIFSQWFIVDLGSKFGFSWYKFRQFWFIPDFMGWKFTPKKELFTYIEKSILTQSFRIKKKDCLDLPNKIYEQKYVEMDNHQYKKYEDMVNNLIVFLSEQTVTVNTILSQIIKLQQIANGFIYNQDKKAIRISDSKINVVKEIIEENPESRIIIWANFREDIAHLYNRLLDNKYNVKLLNSHFSSEIENFQKATGQYILIANPSSCGYAITLTNADIVIYFSNSFKAVDRYQSEDRVHRVGLKHSVVYIDLIAKDTIDEKIYQNLKDKKDLMEEVLDYKEFLKI